MKKLDVGGQAVIEGILMKSPNYFSIAVRKPDKTISLAVKKHISLTKRVKVLSLPFVRGIVNLFEMLYLGIKAMNYSASIAMADEDNKDNIKDNIHKNNKSSPENKKKATEILLVSLSFVFAFAFALLLFKVLPLAIASYLKQHNIIKSTIAFNIIDGSIRILFFLLYVFAISLLKDIKKIFQYHGAEHKAIHCYESGKRLTVKNAMKFTTLHKRCGTSFLMFVLIISILIFSIVPISLPFLFQLLYRIMLLVPIASVSYEFLKLSYKLKDSKILYMLAFPGLMLQKITTSEPTEDQMEVAIKALKAVIRKEQGI